MTKYRAKRTTVDDITFDSKAEADYYSQLKLLKRTGDVLDFSLQPRYLLQDSYKRGNKTIRKIEYIADFLVTYADGHQEIIDVKGMKTPVYKLKKKWFERLYPDLHITEV